MAAKKSLADYNCSLARAVDIVGDRWALLIIRDALLGADSFGEFQASLGIAKNILADRLERLSIEGVLERTLVDGRPRYCLTRKGKGLVPALGALMQWGDAWLADDNPPILILGPDGEPVQPVQLVSGAGDLLSDVKFVAGPGADAQTRIFLKMLAEKQLSPTAKRS